MLISGLVRGAPLVVLVILGAGGTGLGAEPPASDATLTQEWAGFEAAPVALALGVQGRGGEPEGQLGGGLTFRIARHRWRYGYLTPVEAGFFFGADTTLLHAQIEGGVVLPGPLQRLEIGVGAGIGVLNVVFEPTGCDGACKVGGVGPLISPVVRYLFVDGPRMTMGASVRAVIPEQIGRGNWTGYYSGSGQLVTLAFDMAFGAGP